MNATWTKTARNGAPEPEVLPPNCPEAEAGAGAAQDGALLNTQGRTANIEWTRSEWTSICEHLNNENGDCRFVMGFRKHGLKQYVRSRHVPMKRAISWAWSSICGNTKTPMAFAPYSSNNRKQSRWGALDFDAHDGEHERARSFAFAAFRELLNYDFFVVLESCLGRIA
jgi:hypothetical protein